MPVANRAHRAPETEIDLEVAARFLEILGAKRCTFQTFDDNAERKNRKLARILHGNLDEHADQLARSNRLGAGIFVAVNQTDSEGRKRENIKRVRAVTADLDGVPAIAAYIGREPRQVYYMISKRIILRKEARATHHHGPQKPTRCFPPQRG
jgi:hypothetical protein